MISTVAGAGTLPRFEPVDGGFAARASGYSAIVGAHGFAVRNGGARYALQLEAAGAGPCEGLGQLAGRSNYLVGADEGQWRRNVAQFQRVRCREVWPAIDVLYYFTAAGLLEFDLEAAPGADLSRVRIQTTNEGRAFQMRRPVAWQVSPRRPVEARFVKRGAGSYGLAVSGYDPALPLTVDPVVATATYLGGSGGASGEAITTDKQGNVYVAGTVSSNYFPTAEAMQPLFAGSNDIFISKFDPTGRELIYSTYLGSYGDDRALAITVDDAGQVYVAGYSSSPEFPMKGALQARFSGGSLANGGDIVVAALDASGSSLLFSTFLGGTMDDFGRSIALDGEGNIWIAGSTNSQDFPLVNPLQDTYGGGTRDGFVLKLAPMAERVLFSSYVGSAGVDEFYAVRVAREGSVYLAGVSTSQNLPVVNAFQPRYGGGARDILVGHLKADGSEWEFLTYLGGTLEDFCRAMTLDKEDNVFLTGFSLSTNFPRRNAYKNAYGGGRDAFVTKMAADGKSLVWSTYLGGASLEDGFAIAVNEGGEAVVAGHSQSRAFPVVEPVQATVAGNCTREPCTAEIFVTRFNADGLTLNFSTYFGGTAADQSRAVTVGPDGGIWLSGFTASTNFPVENALFPRNTGGGTNIAYVVNIQ
ncbi:MAG: SBBP repeat-containing protein [Acidobacteria bacterium]|nr:SBBP repeat-containing protein [Acidobacteriota bacterium]